MVSILNEGPRTDLVHQKKKIIVGFQCGNSVLRGADVYVPGVSGAPKSKELIILDLCCLEYQVANSVWK